LKGINFDEALEEVPGDLLIGGLDGADLRIAIVVSKWNHFVTSKLLLGASSALQECGVEAEDTLVVWVPGSFEIPFMALELADTGDWDAIVCLGAVIRGETSHFDYVASETARGIASAAAETGVPVSFGILTTDNEQQALDRAGGQEGNKGYDAVMTAIDMANLVSKLREKSDQ
jgi:6,7-dimethyl-8-ribityllumazine synthase